jgi:hypothetical protein
LRHWLIEVTEFGDAAVLLPIAAVMLAWLLLIGARRSAAWWLIAVAFCAGVTAVFKILFYTCPPTPALHSPSGHTSLSTLVYGALMLVMADEARGLPRALAIGGGAALILAIAVSRLLLFAHTGLEIGLGLIIGAGGLILFGQGYRRHRATRVGLYLLIVTGGGLMAALHGQALNSEPTIHAIALYLRIQCP